MLKMNASSVSSSADTKKSGRNATLAIRKSEVKHRARWLPLLPVLLLAACTALPGGSVATPEVQVRQRATERWQALVAHDFDRAYAYAAPSYRKLATVDSFKGKRQGVPVKWIAANVIAVTCNEKKCAVRIELESKPMIRFTFSQNLKAGLDETWVFEDGQWWMLEPV